MKDHSEYNKFSQNHSVSAQQSYYGENQKYNFKEGSLPHLGHTSM